MYAREVNVWIDGVVKATRADEMAAHYEGLHLYSQSRAAGNDPKVGYTVRYVFPPDSTGHPDVREVSAGTDEQRATDAEYVDAVKTYEDAPKRAALAPGVVQPGNFLTANAGAK